MADDRHKKYEAASKAYFEADAEYVAAEKVLAQAAFRRRIASRLMSEAFSDLARADVGNAREPSNG